MCVTFATETDTLNESLSSQFSVSCRPGKYPCVCFNVFVAFYLIIVVFLKIFYFDNGGGLLQRNYISIPSAECEGTKRRWLKNCYANQRQKFFNWKNTSHSTNIFISFSTSIQQRRQISCPNRMHSKFIWSIVLLVSQIFSLRLIYVKTFSPGNVLLRQEDVINFIYVVLLVIV